LLRIWCCPLTPFALVSQPPIPFLGLSRSPPRPHEPEKPGRAPCSSFRSSVCPVDTRSWAGSPRQSQLTRPRHGLVPRPLSPTASCQDRKKSPPARNRRRPVYPAGGHHVRRRAGRSQRSSALMSCPSLRTYTA
jgi:hypothetical protein